MRPVLQRVRGWLGEFAPMVIIGLGTAVLLVVVVVVATPLQEIGFRVMGLAGVSVLVAVPAAVVVTVAAIAEIVLRRDNKARCAAAAAAVVMAWLAVVGIGGAALFGVGERRPVDDRSIPAGAEFTVLTQNMWFRHPDPHTMASGLLEQDVDVLALVEFTDEHAQALAALLDDRYPHQWLKPAETGGGMAVFSRFPLGTPEEFDLYMGAVKMPLEVPTGTVNLVVVHPMAPSSFWGLQRWTGDMVELTRVATRIGNNFGPNSVIAGDFNSSRHHRRFREFQQITAMADVLDLTGAGYAATWPVGRRARPLIRLDHILVGRDVAVVDAGTVPWLGSDHLGVWARLALVEP